MSTEGVRAVPLLTIAIPTWNRASFLANNLAQLKSEMALVAPNVVEVIVSDNCSSDSTQSVVADATVAGLPIRYIRNESNVGWGRNFAQCFDMARGTYVLLLGDDDLLVDGALQRLVECLGERDYGVVCIRPYGFDHDFRSEHPTTAGREVVFGDSEAFLLAIGPLMTMISACIVNRSKLGASANSDQSGPNLPHVSRVLTAALSADCNLFDTRYTVGGKRNNSADYEFGRIFVKEFWALIDAAAPLGLTRPTVVKMEDRMILSYYPHYLLAVRLSNAKHQRDTLAHFVDRFRGRPLFHLWLAPILHLPRPLAIVWGAATTVLGRIIGGEARRGIAFVWQRFKRLIGSAERPAAVHSQPAD